MYYLSEVNQESIRRALSKNTRKSTQRAGRDHWKHCAVAEREVWALKMYLFSYFTLADCLVMICGVSRLSVSSVLPHATSCCLVAMVDILNCHLCYLRSFGKSFSMFCLPK